MLVDGKFEDIISDVVDLIKEEFNVKEVIFVKDLDEYMNFSLKLNFKEVGLLLGFKMNLFVGVLSKLNVYEIVNKFEKGEILIVDLDGEVFEFNKDLVLIGIIVKEGFNVFVENNFFVILDIKLIEELINEGYVREFIFKV